MAEIEAAAPDIAAEYRALVHARIPTYQDMEPINLDLTNDDKWKTYFVHYYDHALPRAERQCPRTVAALRKIPGLQFAMFSILAPGKHVPAHRGPYNGVLRFHLGVDVPDDCEIRIAREHRRWCNGKSLVFDDSFEHEVWNRSDRPRCVLFADIERPLPWPLSTLNHFVLASVGAQRAVEGHAAQHPRLGGGTSPARAGRELNLKSIFISISVRAL